MNTDEKTERNPIRHHILTRKLNERNVASFHLRAENHHILTRFLLMSFPPPPPIYRFLAVSHTNALSVFGWKNLYRVFLYGHGGHQIRNHIMGARDGLQPCRDAPKIIMATNPKQWYIYNPVWGPSHPRFDPVPPHHPGAVQDLIPAGDRACAYHGRFSSHFRALQKDQVP